MKKLLLILICLFVSFEVKSEPTGFNFFKIIEVKDCLKYLDEGRVLHKFEQKNDTFWKVDTIFSYKLKTYKHTLLYKKSIGDSYSIDNSFCEVRDFDVTPEGERRLDFLLTQ